MLNGLDGDQVNKVDFCVPVASVFFAAFTNVTDSELESNTWRDCCMLVYISD